MLTSVKHSVCRLVSLHGLSAQVLMAVSQRLDLIEALLQRLNVVIGP